MELSHTTKKIVVESHFTYTKDQIESTIATFHVEKNQLYFQMYILHQMQKMKRELIS